MLKTKNIRTLMIVLILLIIGSITAWRIYNSQQTAVIAVQPLAVTTAATRLVNKPQVLSLTGTVEGLTSVLISSRFQGKVEQILVEDGQAVQTGATLITLDPLELNNAVRVAENNVRHTEANLHTAQMDFQRYQTLYSQNAITKQQLESTEARLITSRTEVDNAYANLNSAQKQAKDTLITTPVTGVIANKAVTVGQVVSPGNTLLTVEQLDQVYVVVHIEQKDVAAAQLGRDVSITVDAYPGEIFRGTIAVINPAAGNESRMFRVKVKINNPDQLLKPGMFAQTTLSTGDVKTVLAVPHKAIVKHKGLNYVYIDDNKKAKKILVETGELIGDSIEITAGLQENTPVIIDNLDKIKDGDALLTEGGNTL
ncbi:efflux RND transporter periplasmic adaptor subunit [Pelosinus fermentans]|uniref:Efflux transporter, RND family, MFP subunit n=1 Tax=Pelosinus fermentans JBW45 TaxID=1192197 RepID=I9D9K0_9FIRM|nr:efflux RND transporter periplasmic adaptor subunit [Pelosinus fermentans]AJQ25510.1 efflux transporter, RND family, MFP subunit [Pelosinus fermentans JBW45]